MKYITIITLLFAAFAIGAQTTETDSTVIVDDIEILKADTLQNALTSSGEDTTVVVSLDSLVVEIRQSLIADAKRSLDQIDTKIATLKYSKKQLEKERKEQFRKLKKTRKQGFRATITKIFEADEIPAGQVDKTEVLKTILKDRGYKDYKALSDTYRTTNEIKRIARELKLSASGRKSDIAKRIFAAIQ